MLAILFLGVLIVGLHFGVEPVISRCGIVFWCAKFAISGWVLLEFWSVRGWYKTEFLRILSVFVGFDACWILDDLVIFVYLGDFAFC